MQEQNNTHSEEQVFLKLTHYCAYRERCQKEVIEKLKSYGIFGLKADKIVSKLIANNYLNEERFAITYAGGKNRTKGWGEKKIIYHLRQLNISEKLIKTALKQLNNEDYNNKLKLLVEKKWIQLSKKFDEVSTHQKLIHFFVSKGYDVHLIKHTLSEVLNSQKR